MFFWEEDIDPEIVRKEGSLEAKGNYAPHNLDINWTSFNVGEDRSHSRWRFHFIVVFFFFTWVSHYYPLIFILPFIDWSVCTGLCSSDAEQMTEDNYFDYSFAAAEMKGGDLRIHIYVFAYYDRLNYIIYGPSPIGDDYCDYMYKYKNSLGCSDQIKFSKKLKKFKKPLAFVKNNKEKKISLKDNGKMAYWKRESFFYKSKHLNHLTFSNEKISLLLKKKSFLKKDLGLLHYSYSFNDDQSIFWLESNHWKTSQYSLSEDTVKKFKN